MTPYYADPWLTVWQGDCREAMAAMEPESVHCVVTSPPYWGLRDYGTATWEGGDPECAHAFVSDAGATPIRKTQTYQQGHPFRDCRCGARRVDAQLGLEPTPEEYVANMVAVFREVRRVLRPDGTVWLNLGDSYAGGGQTGRNDAATIRGIDAASGRRPNAMTYGDNDRGGRSPRPPAHGLKPKDLVGIPWRVAFALQADGWYLRSDIIWSKPNPMPESVTDRPTKSHEYLFLLSKSARYWYDAQAVAEPSESGEGSRAGFAGYSKRAAAMGRVPSGNEKPGMVALNGASRNIRSVWTIATQPYPGAHFATFPQKLVEPCVKAGCPEGGTVLDPFAGTGTVGLVAQRLSRRAVLIDLSLDYLGQLMDRNRDIPLGLGA